ncbi:MAG: hypothetical protein ACM3UT_08415 [Chloroflexota bacterium]
MKRNLLILCVLLLTMNICAQQIDSATEKIIDDYVISRMLIDKEPADPTLLSQVFSGRFYKVGTFYYYATRDENSVSTAGCNQFWLNINNGKVTEVQQLSSDSNLPDILSLLKKEFLLKDEASALKFEKALDALFPVDEKEKLNVKHMKKNTQWIFLRGKFFDDSTAVIVTTNPNGTVSKVEVVLAYNPAS